MKPTKVRDAKIIGALAVSFAAFLWGVDGIILRPSLYHMNVPLVVFLEHLIALAFMSVFLFPQLGKIKELKKNEWMCFFWIALFGGAIGTMAITSALFLVNFQKLSVILILQKLQPLFAILTASILLGERPERKFYIWASLAIIGSYFITFGFNAPVFEGNSLVIAALLSLLAAFSWGSSTSVGKRAVLNTDFKTATYARFALTTIIMGLILIFTGNVGMIMTVKPPEIMTLVIIALTTGGGAIFIYYYGLKRIKASHATIYELSFPVTAVVLDYIIYGSIMSAGQWLGALLIIYSMTMISRNNDS